jgi:hypothetical protein
MKKKLIIAGIIVLVIVGIIVLFKVLNKDTNLIGKTKIVEGVRFSDAKITGEDGKYTFYVKITTSKDKTLNVEDFDATILDKDGNKIETLSGYIGDIDSKSKKEITIICNEDLSKAYEIVYTVRINND